MKCVRVPICIWVSKCTTICGVRPEIEVDFGFRGTSRNFAVYLDLEAYFGILEFRSASWQVCSEIRIYGEGKHCERVSHLRKIREGDYLALNGRKVIGNGLRASSPPSVTLAGFYFRIFCV